MRIVCLCNNWLGWQVTQWLLEQGEQLAAVVVHPPERAKYLDEIRTVATGAGAVVIEAAQLKDPQVLRSISDLKLDMGVSILFGYLLRKPFLDLLPKGCINLHPALLPYNRGAYPNVWSIAEGTPAGVSLHYINEGVDSGDLIAQREVPVLLTDTGASLYQKLMHASVQLFKETWPSIRSGTACPTQQEGAGTFHRVRDVEQIDEIFLDQTYRAEDLLNVIRARTFPPYAGAYFRHQGRKVYLRLQLVEESIGEAEQA